MSLRGQSLVEVEHRGVPRNCSAVILTDLDNTIYNWVDFFAPSFRAMLHAVAAQTKLPEERLLSQFRTVFVRYGSVEYPYAVQKLEACRELPLERVQLIVRAARVAFGRTRRRRLMPYLGVRETLLWAQRNGIPVIAVSNAPWYIAWRRIWRLGLKGLFWGIAAGPGFSVEDDDHFGEAARLKQIDFVPTLKWELAPELLKPSTTMYELVMRDLGLRPSQLWVVGDSLGKDIRPALELGASGIWAQYGSACDPKNLSTLLAVTHWSKDQDREAHGVTDVTPTATIQSFGELRYMIPSRQPSLWS